MFFPRSCPDSGSTQKEAQDRKEKPIEETILIYFDFFNYLNLFLMLITSFTLLEKWYIWRYIGYKDVTKTKRGEVSGWDN